MKKVLWAGAVLALVAFVAIGPASAGDIIFKPIDTNTLVVKPSQTAASLAARTIDVVGKTTAGAVDNNGYVKTINNLFSRKIIVPTTQFGRSPLPSPNLFPSTQFKSFNSPVMPTFQIRQ